MININKITRKWVSDFTGIDFGQIEDFHLDKGMLKVKVGRYFNPEYGKFRVEFLGDYTQTEYVFELPLPESLSLEGKKDYQNLMALAAGPYRSTIFWSEKLQSVHIHPTVGYRIS